MSDRRNYFVPCSRVHESEETAPDRAGIYLKASALVALLEMEASAEEEKDDYTDVRRYVAARIRQVGAGIARAAADFDALNPPQRP